VDLDVGLDVNSFFELESRVRSKTRLSPLDTSKVFIHSDTFKTTYDTTIAYVTDSKHLMSHSLKCRVIDEAHSRVCASTIVPDGLHTATLGIDDTSHVKGGCAEAVYLMSSHSYRFGAASLDIRFGATYIHEVVLTLYFLILYVAPELIELPSIVTVCFVTQRLSDNAHTICTCHRTIFEW